MKRNIVVHLVTIALACAAVGGAAAGASGWRANTSPACTCLFCLPLLSFNGPHAVDCANGRRNLTRCG